MRSMVRRHFRLLILAVALATGACAAKDDALPPGTTQPDKFLYDRGQESLEKKRWFTAREYFRRIIDGYPQSELRPDAKLGIGDSYLGEGTLESYLLAATEYREFLTFYPTNPRADYAQYKLGMTFFEQMRSPQRDKTETREAVKELQTFVERYPNSALLPEVKNKLREARDRVGESEYQVGVFYYKQRWYPGAIARLRALMKSDPEFTYRDGLYYHLAEALLKVKLDAEALPLYERLIAEFQQSEYLDEALARRDELKANLAEAGAPMPAPETGQSEEGSTSGQTSAPEQEPAPAEKPVPPQSGGSPR